jgi:parallel beta-helix repeat protein
VKKVVLGLILIAVVCISSFALAGVATACAKNRNWIVSKDGTGNFLTIQSALNSAKAGDSVSVKSGTYFEHLTISVSVSLKGENKATTIIDAGGVDPGSVIVVAANNVLISGFTIQNARYGGNAIWVDSYNGTTISNNIIQNTGDGIRILHSKGNMISNNIIRNNPFTALGFDWSFGNTITGNVISNNYIGIGAGYPSYNNIFTNNVIAQNTYGFLMSMYSCKFYHNNIINNAIQAQFYSAYSNKWDNGYPSGGNYWSNFAGADILKGIKQNKLGSDGIGDTSYTIDTTNVDNYPLMTPLKLP